MKTTRSVKRVRPFNVDDELYSLVLAWAEEQERSYSDACRYLLRRALGPEIDRLRSRARLIQHDIERDRKHAERRVRVPARRAPRAVDPESGELRVPEGMLDYRPEVCPADNCGATTEMGELVVIGAPDEGGTWRCSAPDHPREYTREGQWFPA